MLLFHQAFVLLIQMFSVFTLNDLQNLHRHIRLIQDTSGKRKSPEIACIRVADRQVNVGDVHQPVSVFCVQFRIIPAVENLVGKRDYFPSFPFGGVKKLADAYSPIIFPVRSSFS